MFIWLLILPCITSSQDLRYVEFLNIPIESYLQMALIYGPYQQEVFNAGYIQIGLQFMVNSYLTQLLNVSVVLFQANQSTMLPNEYQCLMSRLQYHSYVKNENYSSICNLNQLCQYTLNPPHQNSNNINVSITLPTSSPYCLLNYNSSNLQNQNISFSFSQTPELNVKSSQEYVIVFINYCNSSQLNLLQSYTVDVQGEVSFYEISLVLCVCLGILVIILISVLCIINYKYQRVKEENITLKLVRGSADYNQKLKGT